MNKYKKLLDEYDVLKQKYDDAINSLKESKDTCKRLNLMLEDMAYSNNTHVDLIQFLITEKFSNNKTIEFAGIKTYRDGWVTLCVNGEQYNPRKDKNVTIWADVNEPVKVEVSSV